MIAKPEDTRLASLEAVGLQFSENDADHIFWNLSPADLYEQALKHGERELTDKGRVERPHRDSSPVAAPKTKFFVKQAPPKT